MLGFITLTVTLSVFFIYMGLLRPADSIFSSRSRQSLLENIDRRLKKAGIINLTALAALSLLLIGMSVIAVISMFAFGNIFLTIVIVLLVPLFFNIFLNNKSRRFQDKLNERLVPFMRKVESQLRAGQNPLTAFVNAAYADDLISWVIKDPLKDLELQRNLNDVLEDTVELIPIISWLQFVRAMQSFSETGGQLADNLSANVSRINSKLLLKQRLMGDVAQYRGQQYVLLGFAIGMPLFMSGAAGDTFGNIFSSFIGIVAFVMALGMNIFALWLTNNAINDVVKRLD